MNWTIEYIESLDIVKVITDGNFEIEDHLKMIQDIISRDFWKPGKDIFFDHRKLNFRNTTIPLMKKISENHKIYEQQIGDGKAAILMKSLADFARGRQFELLTEHNVSAKISIFMDEAKTLQWLTSSQIKQTSKVRQLMKG